MPVLSSTIYPLEQPSLYTTIGMVSFILNRFFMILIFPDQKEKKLLGNSWETPQKGKISYSFLTADPGVSKPAYALQKKTLIMRCGFETVNHAY
jgi:hypothetical protein